MMDSLPVMERQRSDYALCSMPHRRCTCPAFSRNPGISDILGAETVHHVLNRSPADRRDFPDQLFRINNFWRLRT
jgi:hypothetical protein